MQGFQMSVSGTVRQTIPELVTLQITFVAVTVNFAVENVYPFHNWPEGIPKMFLWKLWRGISESLVHAGAKYVMISPLGFGGACARAVKDLRTRAQEPSVLTRYSALSSALCHYWFNARVVCSYCVVVFGQCACQCWVCLAQWGYRWNS